MVLAQTRRLPLDGTGIRGSRERNSVTPCDGSRARCRQAPREKAAAVDPNLFNFSRTLPALERDRMANLARSFSRLAMALSLTFLASATAAATTAKKPCQPSLAECPDEGCGKTFDPNLNRRKNIRSDNQTSTVHTLSWLKGLSDPDNFEAGGSREELTNLGEGQAITVVGYLLMVKPEGAESCNCGLTDPVDTDNHLVLVTKTTIQKFPAGKTTLANKNVFRRREKESVTIEFTPRARRDHENFTRQVVQPLIDATPQKVLLVRVSGLLLFDSEHFIRHPLVRVTNWEIHPVLKLEFCRSGNCQVDSDQGWTSLDDLR